MSQRVYIGLGLAAVGAAALFDPTLTQLLPGVEDQPRLFRTTELQLFRYGLALAGVLLLLCVLAWERAAGSPWRMRLEREYTAFLADPRVPTDRQRAFGRSWVLLAVAVAIGIIVTIRLSFRFHLTDTLWYDILAREGGILETLTAAAFLAAGVVLLLTVRRFRAGFEYPVSIWPAVVLAVMFIVAAGEEMSWGQVWFPFDTPTGLKVINSQDEFNLHNIDSHLVNHLATLFFLAYGAVLPLAARLIGPVGFVCNRLNVPVPSVSLVPFILLGVLLSDHALFTSLWGSPPWRLSEGRELLFGTVMLGMSISYYLERRTT